MYICAFYNDTSFSVALVMSKTRVSRLKTISIPKLELNAALLTTKLLKSTAENLKLTTSSIYAWTDSEVVLAWLSKHSTRWKTFMANRVGKIHNDIPSFQWSHVISEQNPAVYVSRGLTPAQLINKELWWEGPCFHSTNGQHYYHPSRNQEDHHDHCSIQSQLPLEAILQLQATSHHCGMVSTIHQAL